MEIFKEGLAWAFAPGAFLPGACQLSPPLFRRGEATSPYTHPRPLLGGGLRPPPLPLAGMLPGD
jgi:hypothetical protein